jgi:hypothetical protein
LGYSLGVEERYVKSAAYHEAGHVVVAIAQGLPILQEGICIDRNGGGLARYVESSIGLEQVVVAIKAGYMAQERFYPGCPYAFAYVDVDKVLKLLETVYTNRPLLDAAQDRLNLVCRRLVSKHWNAIETLATSLWAKNWEPQRADRRWSADADEKRMEGAEIVDRLRSYQLEAVVFGDR